MEDDQIAINNYFSLEEIPDIQIKTIHIRNFKAYDDFTMYFVDNGGNIKPFVCFIGENGAGKSTVLNAIQMIFQRYDGYDNERLINQMKTCVRHVSSSITNSCGDDFLIEADIRYSRGDYTVRLNKNGFIDDHPDEIKQLLYRLCYYTKFDRDLHQFQLTRDKWEIFKSLFESVTGYEIEEINDVFSYSEDPIQARLMDKYVLGFLVKKPFETISHKECSNGEKKVIKSFSTLLNLEIAPRVILIDDIAMHVALSRHIALIEAMQRCYPDSQIFSTTHSYRITKSLRRIDEIYDLRLMHANEIIVSEPWRLRLMDEIDDALYKLDGLNSENGKTLHEIGKKIRVRCTLPIRDLRDFQKDVMKFLKEVSDLYIIGVLSRDGRSIEA
jgi:AAA15 family ATPase/GTPase